MDPHLTLLLLMKFLFDKVIVYLPQYVVSCWCSEQHTSFVFVEQFKSNSTALMHNNFVGYIRQGSILAPGKYIFRDNAYVNSLYVYGSTPYKKGDRFQDNYNVYHHSQLRITVECAAFGMLVQKLSILQRALHASFGLASI